LERPEGYRQTHHPKPPGIVPTIDGAVVPEKLTVG
jgi:large subunit ribosomal protein L12e